MPDRPTMVPPPPEGLLEKREQHNFYNWEAWPHTPGEYDHTKALFEMGAELEMLEGLLPGGFSLHVSYIHPEWMVRIQPSLDSHSRNAERGRGPSILHAGDALRAALQEVWWCDPCHIWHPEDYAGEHYDPEVDVEDTE